MLEEFSVFLEKSLIDLSGKILFSDKISIRFLFNQSVFLRKDGICYNITLLFFVDKRGHEKIKFNLALTAQRWSKSRSETSGQSNRMLAAMQRLNVARRGKARTQSGDRNF